MISDFVRGHSVVRVLKQRWPNRPVDLLVTSLCAPLVDYMPGVRSGIVWDLPRGRLVVFGQVHEAQPCSLSQKTSGSARNADGDIPTWREKAWVKAGWS